MNKDRILKLQMLYKTDGKIGKVLGMTRQAVQQYRKKFGIPALKEKYVERNKLILEAKKAGKSTNDLCEAFGLCYSQVHRIINNGRTLL